MGINDLKEIKNQIGLIKYGWIYTTQQGTIYSFDTKKPTTLILTNTDFLKVSGVKVIEGDFFLDRDLYDREKVALVGINLAKVLFSDQNYIGRQIVTSEGSFTVVGVIKLDRDLIVDNSQMLDLVDINTQIVVPYALFLKNQGTKFSETLEH